MWHKKKTNISISTAERSSQVTSVVKFIPTKFWSLTQVVSKVVLDTGLNAYIEGSWFVTSSLLVCYDWSKRRSTSCTNLIFPVAFTKACPVLIQNNTHWWWIEIKKIPKSQKVHISSHDELQKLHNINLAWHRFQGFLRERVEKRISSFPYYFF